jgi:hypothetical protein
MKNQDNGDAIEEDAKIDCERSIESEQEWAHAWRKMYLRRMPRAT